MASVGGGWMSDWDNFPLNMKPSFNLPNKGTFTSYSEHVPNLIVGSASEWIRIAKVMFDNYDEQSQHGSLHWSDMFALSRFMRLDLHLIDGKIVSRSRTISIQDIYNIPTNTSLAQDIEKPYDFDKEQCRILNKYKAVHISHHGCNIVKFCQKYSQRPVAARKWFNAWSTQCKEQNKKK